REEIVLEEMAPGMAVRLEKIFAMAEGRKQPILDGVSLKIPAGMALGVKGPSGSGKSTLARALLGIWPEMRGEVFYDDVPIRGMNRSPLGASLGYLPQDVELFEGTIAENVARFGKVDSSLVIEACSQAGVHEMILRFPNGYDTFIGDGGSFLSGGQRQRIGLARAIYGNPRLVILDEPNSNLDEAGDRALLQVVKALKEHGATLVLISHRPQIMGAMDLILVVEEGRAVRLETPRQARQASNNTTAVAPAGGTAGAAPGQVPVPSGTSPDTEPKPPRRPMFMPV
ncbi:MAG: ATP-binding cassette domain-containing protein, partial [Azoarcus sp.]|nr:ATP-binding cassette domain-containing protein [Azoarcus sp.]